MKRVCIPDMSLQKSMGLDLPGLLMLAYQDLESLSKCFLQIAVTTHL